MQAQNQARPEVHAPCWGNIYTLFQVGGETLFKEYGLIFFIFSITQFTVFEKTTSIYVESALQIKPVQSEDSGVYSCSAANKHSNSISSDPATMELTVQQGNSVITIIIKHAVM